MEATPDGLVDVAPSAQLASRDSFSKALVALLSPTVDVGETIRRVVLQQQALNREIDELNHKIGLCLVQSTSHQQEIETYVGKLKAARLRVDALNKLFAAIKARMLKLHEKIVAKTKGLETSSDQLRESLVSGARASSTVEQAPASPEAAAVSEQQRETVIENTEDPEELRKAEGETEAEEKAKAEAEQKAKSEAEAKAKAKAEQKAKAEAEAKAKAEAEQKAKAEAEQKAKAETKAKAKAEAEQKAKEEDEKKAKAKAEAEAKEESDRKAKAEAEAEQKTKEEEATEGAGEPAAAQEEGRAAASDPPAVASGEEAAEVQEAAAAQAASEQAHAPAGKKGKSAKKKGSK